MVLVQLVIAAAGCPLRSCPPLHNIITLLLARLPGCVGEKWRGPAHVCFRSCVAFSFLWASPHWVLGDPRLTTHTFFLAEEFPCPR